MAAMDFATVITFVAVIFSAGRVADAVDSSLSSQSNKQGKYADNGWGEVHAAYDCALPDRKNASSWLDFGWDLLDVLHFGGPTVFVQRDGFASWKSTRKCNPIKNADEAALIAHAHANKVRVLLAVHFNNSLGADMFFQFLNDEVAMKNSAHSICTRARNANCDGISLDFEVLNTRFNTTFKGLYAN